jgi:TetR/AcrR family transcriptional regulator, transcriptional repressor for nem operon
MATTPTRKNPRERKRSGDTRERALDVAERLVQLRGFNAFSYADVAGELGITKASLHYHFPGKAELGEALIVRYTRRFSEALATIDTGNTDAPAKLRAYLGLYTEVLRGRRMCLCGMLAAEYQTLPKPMRDAVIAFFEANEKWLAGTLAQGRDEQTLRFQGSPQAAAQMIISALQGAMLIARPTADLKGFQTNATALLATISGTQHN